MSLSSFCVRRPVFAAVGAIIICVVGAAAFMSLPIRELPSVDPPQVSVSTSYRGAFAGAHDDWSRGWAINLPR